MVIAVLLVSAGVGYLIYNSSHSDDENVSPTPIPHNNTTTPSEYTFVDANGLTWYNSYEKGKAEAARTSRPIILDLYTEWCHWCKVMDEQTYSDPAVKSEMGNFVLIKIDGDKHPGLVSSFSVTGYPTILLLGPDGEELDRIVGYSDASSFLSSLRAVE